MLNKPIPPNNVLDPKHNGWLINRIDFSGITGITEIYAYNPNGPWDSFGPVKDVGRKIFPLDGNQLVRLQNAFDWQEYNELSEKLRKVEERLGIHSKVDFNRDRAEKSCPMLEWE